MQHACYVLFFPAKFLQRKLRIDCDSFKCFCTAWQRSRVWVYCTPRAPLDSITSCSAQAAAWRLHLRLMADVESTWGGKENRMCGIKNSYLKVYSSLPLWVAALCASWCLGPCLCPIRWKFLSSHRQYRAKFVTIGKKDFKNICHFVLTFNLEIHSKGILGIYYNHNYFFFHWIHVNDYFMSSFTVLYNLKA